MTPIELVASREDLIAAELDVQYNVKIDNQYLGDGTELDYSSNKNWGVTNSHTNRRVMIIHFLLSQQLLAPNLLISLMFSTSV